MKTKIFFDGNCIVCDMEISHYKRKAPDLFELVDISAPGFDAKFFSLTKDSVERELHVLTPQGELLVGVDAFAHIWSRIERYRPLVFLVQLPGLYSLARIGYKFFTIIRPYLPKRKPD